MVRTTCLIFILTLSAALVGQLGPAPRPSINGIAHITLYAYDLAKSQTFYESLLGWKMVPDGHPQSSVRCCANHQQYVEVVAPPAPDRVDRLVSVAFSMAKTFNPGFRR